MGARMCRSLRPQSPASISTESAGGAFAVTAFAKIAEVVAVRVDVAAAVAGIRAVSAARNGARGSCRGGSRGQVVGGRDVL